MIEINFFFLQQSLEEWRIVFWIAFVIFIVTSIVYMIWASGEVQDFNTPNLLNKSAESDDYSAYPAIEEKKKNSFSEKIQ